MSHRKSFKIGIRLKRYIQKSINEEVTTSCTKVETVTGERGTCSTPPSPIHLISNQGARVKYVLMKFLWMTPNCKLSGYRELDKEEPVGFVDWNARKWDNSMM